jgi:hypothetical protein
MIKGQLECRLHALVAVGLASLRQGRPVLVWNSLSCTKQGIISHRVGYYAQDCSLSISELSLGNRCDGYIITRVMATICFDEANCKTAPRYLRFALPAHVPEILIQPIHNLKSLDSIYSLSETGAHDEQAALLSWSQTRSVFVDGCICMCAGTRRRLVYEVNSYSSKASRITVL